MKFTKPIGSTADLREIEYISALHQTGTTLRGDGSITSADIALFLISRYGISVDENEITNTIMKGFGGGGISEADGDTLDLTELVAMLLIPTLVRTKRGMVEKDEHDGCGAFADGNIDDADEVVGGNYRVGHGNVVDEFDNNSAFGQSAKGITQSEQSNSLIDTNESFVVRDDTTPSSRPNKKLFQYVLQMILADTIHATPTSTPPPLTVDLLRSIFLFYGEKDLAADTALLGEMVELAKDAGETLDSSVFAHCCTSDVELYDTEWEQSLTSTYVDVFETHASTKKGVSQSEDVEGSAEYAGENEREKVNEVLKKYTFPAIDYAVDTFRSKVGIIEIPYPSDLN
jgi:hypothetical protein